jgi:hypothetical protein
LTPREKRNKAGKRKQGDGEESTRKMTDKIHLVVFWIYNL